MFIKHKEMVASALIWRRQLIKYFSCIFYFVQSMVSTTCLQANVDPLLLLFGNVAVGEMRFSSLRGIWSVGASYHVSCFISIGKNVYGSFWQIHLRGMVDLSLIWWHHISHVLAYFWQQSEKWSTSEREFSTVWFVATVDGEMQKVGKIAQIF